MHVQKLNISHIRSLRKFEFSLDRQETGGWHVLLGDNGTGKSTVIRALALALMGQSSAHATQQDWSRWLPRDRESGYVSVNLIEHEEDRWTGSGRKSARPIFAKAEILADIGGGKYQDRRLDIKFTNHYAARTIWGTGFGWFSASFGPFRRFSGGDPKMDRLFMSHPLLAPHLSAFGEDVALGESLLWLQDLATRGLEGDGEAEKTQGAVIDFINQSGLLPHESHIAKVSSEQVEIVDGHGSRISIDEMSDGFRSVLSLTLELMRLLFRTFGTTTVLKTVEAGKGTIPLPGVVAIDEVDTHLHPTWQQRIGDWFVSRFPKMQFIVASHSPIICRAARNGSVWALPSPESTDEPRRVRGADFERLVDGNILDAFGTELFGADVTRSRQSRSKLDRLAHLNRIRLTCDLSPEEQEELSDLRMTLPSQASTTAPK